MELMSGGEVFNHICEDGSFSEQRAARIVRDVARALQGMHSAKVVHRDIKVSFCFTVLFSCVVNTLMWSSMLWQPENLLYASADKKVVKVADFGLAKMKDRGVILKTACGTPDYVGMPDLHLFVQLLDDRLLSCWALCRSAPLLQLPRSWRSNLTTKHVTCGAWVSLPM